MHFTKKHENIEKDEDIKRHNYTNSYHGSAKRTDSHTIFASGFAVAGIDKTHEKCYNTADIFYNIVKN